LEGSQHKPVETPNFKFQKHQEKRRSGNQTLVETRNILGIEEWLGGEFGAVVD
jgi:hypothetical protein